MFQKVVLELNTVCAHLFAVCSNELGLGDRTKITDQQLTASSEKGSGYPARDGRIMPK